MAPLGRHFEASGLVCVLLAVGSLAAPINSTAAPFVIDSFQNSGSNDVGGWSGPGEGMPIEYGDGYLNLYPTTPDMDFHTRVSSSCLDMTGYMDMYLHIAFSGTDKFSISFTQNNDECNELKAPYPATWDSLEAARYSNGKDIYIPLHHFTIDFSKANSVAVHGFYTEEPVTLYTIEVVSDIPEDTHIPEKLPSGIMAVSCKRPNSFAFGIDDGRPEFAREVMQILAEEDIKVTFFTVGNGLVDPTSNFTSMYHEMLWRGHQVALHTYSHPR